MKYIELYKILSSFILSILVFNPLSAQVNGNGNFESKKYNLSDFDEIHITFPAKVNITTNQYTDLQIVTDDNIFDYISVDVKGDKLTIDQIEWIEPSKRAEININIPDLKFLKTGGYGEYSVNIDAGSRIEIDNPVGNIVLNGEASELVYTSVRGNLNAEDLVTNKVSANITSFGRARVQATDVIDAKLYGQGRLVYLYEPTQLKIKNDKGGQVLSIEDEVRLKADEKKVAYVRVKLFNNIIKRIDTRIEGPFLAPFGYGTPFNPLQKKDERFPVGTKIYRQGKFGSETLLYEVKEADDGKTIKLF